MSLHKYYILTIIYTASFINGMEQETLPLSLLPKELELHIFDMTNISCMLTLRETCHTYSTVYATPQLFDRPNTEYTQWISELTPIQYTKALIHYAQNDNMPMIKRMITFETKKQRD